jgi:hypothetical protein
MYSGFQLIVHDRVLHAMLTLAVTRNRWHTVVISPLDHRPHMPQRPCTPSRFPSSQQRCTARWRDVGPVRQTVSLRDGSVRPAVGSGPTTGPAGLSQGWPGMPASACFVLCMRRTSRRPPRLLLHKRTGDESLATRNNGYFCTGKSNVWFAFFRVGQHDPPPIDAREGGAGSGGVRAGAGRGSACESMPAAVVAPACSAASVVPSKGITFWFGSMAIG